MSLTRFTRQLMRAELRRRSWAMMSGEKALATVDGIIPRRIRRAMAMKLAKRKPNVEGKKVDDNSPS